LELVGEVGGPHLQHEGPARSQRNRPHVASEFGPVPEPEVATATLETDSFKLNHARPALLALGHDLIGKPVSTFPDHALAALQELNRYPLRPTDEAHAHARPHRGRLLGEYDALGPELGRHRVDTAHGESEMVEALIRRGRRWIDAVVGRDRRDEDVGAA